MGGKAGYAIGMKSAFAVLLLALLGTAACGDDDDDDSAASQGAARDRATRAACDKYAECDAIGNGAMYETRESCEIDQRAAWDDLWPAGECDGQIDQSQLEACEVTIQTAECGNLLDFVNIIANKCSRANVCGG